jgi:hypothetical protein
VPEQDCRRAARTETSGWLPACGPLSYVRQFYEENTRVDNSEKIGSGFCFPRRCNSMAKTFNSSHLLQHCKCFVVLEGLFECKCTPGTILFEAACWKKALMRTTQDNTTSGGVTAPGRFFTRLSEISVLLCLSISPIAAAPSTPIPFKLRLRMRERAHLGSVRAAENSCKVSITIHSSVTYSSFVSALLC